MHSLSHHEFEHVYTNAVCTIQSQMYFQDAVNQLETVALAGHGKAAIFLAELYFQGFRVERDSHKAHYWKNLATLHA